MPEETPPPKTIVQTDDYAKWIGKLRDRVAVQRINKSIHDVQHGKTGKVNPLRAGVSEIKVDYGPGYRVYFTEREGIYIILLCGGDKTTQQADINAAIDMARKY
ncbi:hypothetical protein GCM10007874_49820 [Labrys miyagiensis]|uniref:Addiction module killer protein n=1 Tax=Labrys miyagiensis TaxID=346912 RepID=A0ABQ6CP87_9HYPH|nr:type II toxin-antitoxin system RelE/ParE family toxin [Labrys miyagiensis]GLS21965.1 hypothetical protein GCM10007874_49820 [Labrys miyagiensis]